MNKQQGSTKSVDSDNSLPDVKDGAIEMKDFNETAKTGNQKPLGGVAVMPGGDFKKTPGAFNNKRESVVSDMSYDDPVTQVSHVANFSTTSTKEKPLPDIPNQS